MARITQEQVNAWTEKTKFRVTITGTDEDLLTQLEEEVLVRIAVAYETAGWTNSTNTPLIVQVAIAKLFVAWAYRKAYSESLEDEDAVYAAKLELNAETIISAIANGDIEIPGETPVGGSTPSFYPTDASSAMEPTHDDPSLGPARFSMGAVF